MPHSVKECRGLRPFSRLHAILVSTTIAAAAPLVGAAAPRDTQENVKFVQAVRMATALKIDGRLDEEAWSFITPYTDFRQREPYEGDPSTERTELRIGYDNDALYVGVRLFDSHPDEIISRRTRRDGEGDADAVTLYLDPRHDHLTGFMFSVSAGGVQRDGIIFNDWETSADWDGVWTSAVNRDEDGWSAEMRIPFSQLRFAAGGDQTWGINLSRTIPRKHETAWLEVVPKQERGVASRMAHLAGLNGVTSTLHLELLPYTVARAEFIGPPPGDPFNDGSRIFGGAGLDLKWGLTSGLTLNATANPDFGQVEVDPAVINLTAFETFFQEKRPFFVEGSQIFTNFGRGGSGSALVGTNLFYSRRVGLSPSSSVSAEFVDSPRATTILGAAKLTGKIGDGWSVGLLEAVTNREYARLANGDLLTQAQIQPLTNYVVGRLMKEGSRAGFGLLTTLTSLQLSTAGLRNQLADRSSVAGVDGYAFLDGRRNWVVSGQMAGSWLEGTPSAILKQQRSSRRYYQRPDADYVHEDPTAVSLSGWSGAAGLRNNNGPLTVHGDLWATNPGFEVNDLGFQNRADVSGASTGFNWRKLAPDRLTRERQIDIVKTWRWDFGGRPVTDSWAATASMLLNNYWLLYGGTTWNGKVFDNSLTRGGPTALAPQSLSGSIGLTSDTRKRFILGTEWIQTRDSAGGWEDFASVYFNVRPGAVFAFSSGPYVTRLHSVAQYLDTVVDANATSTFGARYVFSNIDQTNVGFTTRFNVSLTPTTSLQFYIEPFFGVGKYGLPKELARPGTFDFLQYGRDIGTSELNPVTRTYAIDPDGAGPSAPFDIAVEDFNSKYLVAKAVWRWEWRAGSTLYVAWTQQASDETHPGQFSLARDFRSLLHAPADDVLLVKISYWFGR
jgi:hypothetical protein